MKKNRNELIKRWSSGFTLIELIVVMAIVGIMAGIIVTNMAKNPDRGVRQEKERLASFVRSVQYRAITGQDLALLGRLCGFGLKYVGSTTPPRLQVFYLHTANKDTECNLSAATETDLADEFYIPTANNKAEITILAEKLFFSTPNGGVYGGADGKTPLADDFPIQIKSTESGSVTSEVIITKSGEVR